MKGTSPTPGTAVLVVEADELEVVEELVLVLDELEVVVLDVVVVDEVVVAGASCRTTCAPTL